MIGGQKLFFAIGAFLTETLLCHQRFKKLNLEESKQ